jgi:hypothetical protein
MTTFLYWRRRVKPIAGAIGGMMEFRSLFDRRSILGQENPGVSMPQPKGWYQFKLWHIESWPD